MEKLLKKSGAERVSDKAKTTLKEMLEDYGIKIGEKASKLAKHAGRRTIKAEDVKLAYKQ